jgi:hypothetical protein
MSPITASKALCVSLRPSTFTPTTLRVATMLRAPTVTSTRDWASKPSETQTGQSWRM